MKTILPRINVKPSEEAYLLLSSEIDNIPDKDAERPRKSASVVIENLHVYFKYLEEDLPIINHHFKFFSINDVELLLNKARAFWCLETRFDNTKHKSARKEVYTEANKLRKKAIQLLELTYGDNQDITHVIKVTKPGHSYVDRANDLLILHPILEEKREKLIASGLISDEEINRIGELPEILIDNTRDDKKAARLLRNKAWTLFIKGYYELRRHLEFIHYYNPERLKKYPSLFAHKKGKRKKDDPKAQQSE